MADWKKVRVMEVEGTPATSISTLYTAYPSTAPGPSKVVLVFPGDLQTTQEKMGKSDIGRELLEYAYEPLIGRLQEQLGGEEKEAEEGGKTAVYLVAPKRMVDDRAVFDHLLLGGRTLVYIQTLVANLGVEANTPVWLVGFSSGAAVLNRVWSELLHAIRGREEEAQRGEKEEEEEVKPIVRMMREKAAAANNKVLQFVETQVEGLIWLDPATGPELDPLCTTPSVLDAAGSWLEGRACGPLSVLMYSSEGQVNDVRRPWIRPSLQALYDMLSLAFNDTALHVVWDVPDPVEVDVGDGDGVEEEEEEGQGGGGLPSFDEMIAYLSAHFSAYEHLAIP